MNKFFQIIFILFILENIICEECSNGEICEVDNYAEISEVVNIFISNIDNIEGPHDGSCAIRPFEIEYEIFLKKFS